MQPVVRSWPLNEPALAGGRRVTVSAFLAALVCVIGKA